MDFDHDGATFAIHRAIRGPGPGDKEEREGKDDAKSVSARNRFIDIHDISIDI